MSAASLPATGSIEVVRPQRAADLVESVAEDPDLVSARLLIALDIDGTVLREDETLSPGVVEAVAHAQGAGHEVMLATGRSWGGTHRVLESLGIAPQYVVCSNGAVIMKREHGEEPRYARFHTETFDATRVLTMLRDELPDAHYMVELADGARLFTEELHDWNLADARQVAFEELSAHPVSRVVVVSPGDTEQVFVDLIRRVGLSQVTYAVGWTAWLDIAPDGVDKSSALELVRRWLGVEAADVLVMGDGHNDVGMFRWALRAGGRAVAMAQGPQEVRDAAGETTASVHAGGVADVLRKL